MAYIFKTTRGGSKLVDEDGAVFELHRRTSGKINWRCENVYTGCKSKLHTKVCEIGETPIILTRIGEHEHPNNSAKNGARVVFSKLK